ALTAACSSFTPFIIVRAMFGLGEGPLYPALANFNYRWYHRTERARASSFMLAGSFVGPIVGPPVTVALMGAWGWQSVFVIFGLLGVVIAAFWWFLTKERPEDCKYINKEELAWIKAGTDAAASGEKEKTPWGKFFKSGQFWAVGLQYFFTDYVMFVYLAWLPLYLMEAQGFSLKSMGIAAALPWLALCLMTFATGGISDRLIQKGMSKNIARTMFGVIGLAICCVTLYLGAVSTNQIMTVVWLTISLGSLGFLFTTSWAVCADIGGKHVGAVSGWMNFCGNIGGVLAPIVTAYIATTYGWQSAIVATAAMTVLGIIAWFFVKPDKAICE
ncbi:MAG: MFS transporter, partial [Selenomonadales bacterium]|nr:MFS transporter [Selenomonadales bacterium]